MDKVATIEVWLGTKLLVASRHLEVVFDPYGTNDGSANVYYTLPAVLSKISSSPYTIKIKSETPGKSLTARLTPTYPVATELAGDVGISPFTMFDYYPGGASAGRNNGFGTAYIGAYPLTWLTSVFPSNTNGDVIRVFFTNVATSTTYQLYGQGQTIDGMPNDGRETLNINEPQGSSSSYLPAGSYRVFVDNGSNPFGYFGSSYTYTTDNTVRGVAY